MKTQRSQVRIDNGYECRISLEFMDIHPDEGIEKPVEGELKIRLGEGIPHPVEIGIDDIDVEAGDADYVEFETRRISVHNRHDYPVVFRFIANPSFGKGGKWYFYKTANWAPNPDIEPYENKEFVKHHVAIPSAQKIRLSHRILNDKAGAATITDLTELYDKRTTEAVSEFSDDIKGHVGFSARAKIQNFLVGNSNFHRSHSDVINKVAKQLVEDEYRHRVHSLEEVEDMVDRINGLENFPAITVEEVFKRVIERSDEQALNEIAGHLDLDDWSVVFSRFH
jgi:hypothetical protein